MKAQQTGQTRELDQSAQYWLDTTDSHLICDAWAIDDVDLQNWDGPKLVFVSAAGTPHQIQEAARALRNRRANAHLTSSDQAKWRSSLDTAALSNSHLIRAPLPETGFHHMTLVPTDNWYEHQHHLTAVRAELPIYLFPNGREELPTTLGNALRRMTELLCPPQWDHALLRICQRLQAIQEMDSHGILAWRLSPMVEQIQAGIQKQVSAGHLSL